MRASTVDSLGCALVAVDACDGREIEMCVVVELKEEGVTRRDALLIGAWRIKHRDWLSTYASRNRYSSN